MEKAQPSGMAELKVLIREEVDSAVERVLAKLGYQDFVVSRESRPNVTIATVRTLFFEGKRAVMVQINCHELSVSFSDAMLREIWVHVLRALPRSRLYPGGEVVYRHPYGNYVRLIFFPVAS